MTVITQTRTYDASKELKTNSGKELAGFIDATNTTFETVLRALKNGLSFKDNVNCEIREVDLKHGVPQQITAKNKVDMVFVGRVYSEANPLDKPLHWYMNSKGDLNLLAYFKDSPTLAIKVRIVILFS